MAAVAEHRSAVGQSFDLVHAVGNIKDRDVLHLQSRQQRIDFFDVRARQGGGRLVEDEKLRLLAERLGDFDHLAARQRQIAHAQQRIDVLAADFGKQCLGAPALRTVVDHAEAPGRR